MATRKAGRKGAAKRGAKKGGRKSSSRKGGARKASSRRGAAKRGGAKRAKRTPNAAFMKPMQPTEELAAVVGSKPMPRTEVTKQLWGYIRKNGLQDQKNRRMINADDRLRAVFGGRRQVSMFEMTKLVNQHLKNT